MPELACEGETMAAPASLAVHRSAPAAAAPAECHAAADMPGQVHPGALATVHVTLSPERIEQAVSLAFAGTLAPFAVQPDQPLIVDIVPRKAFVLAPGHEPASVAAPTDAPVELYFMVRATEAGQGEIWAVVRQGTMPLATLKLRPIVLAMDLPKPLPLQQAESVLAKAASAWPANVLLITEQNSDNGPIYRFEFQSPALGVLRCFSPPIRDREGFVANIYKDIEQRWLGSRAQREAFDESMKEIGFQLWEKLIPRQLQERLWSARPQLESIFVLSEEPFIPWELLFMSQPGAPMHPDGHFLGELGLVRWLYEAGSFPPVRLPLAQGKARYVIPDYIDVPAIHLAPLPEARMEATFLRERFGATEVRALQQPLRDLLSAPAAFDLLHFAGHGFAADATVNDPQLMLEGEYVGGANMPNMLASSTIEARANFGPARPFIVLNACQAGRATWALTGIGGFAQAFVKRGAGAFVGTLWSVGDAPARLFTEALYAELDAGVPMAEAVRTARKAAKSGDASWLAYTVYAHPDAQLAREPPGNACGP